MIRSVLTVDQLLLVLWKRKWTFLLTFVLVVAAAAAVTFTMAKRYEASSYLLVASSRTAASDFEATQTNQVLSKTYAELLQTRNTADAVAAELPFPATGPGLQHEVDVQPIPQSQLIRITVEESSPERAKEIADTYARVFVERVEALGGPSDAVQVTIGENAALETIPVRPRPKLYLAIGILFGLFLAAGAALLRQRLDQRLELESGTTELLGLPILGRVPQRGTSRKDEPLDPRLADAFRLVLANLTFANLGVRPRTLAVVSAGEAEGKSTTALNVARSAVELGARVLLADGDLRRPGLTAMLREESREAGPGFSSLLLSPERLGSVLGEDRGAIRFVPAGPLPPNPAALLGSDGLREFERAARELYDLTVIDTPPLLVGADASLVAAQTEGVVLVVDASRTKRTALTQAVDQLQRAQANILGVIVNRSAESAGGYYYKSDKGDEPAVEDDVEAFSGPSRSPGA